MKLIIILIWSTSCFAGQVEVYQWHLIMSKAKAALNFEVNTVWEDNTFKLLFDGDVDALKFYLSNLSFEELRFIMDFHQVLNIQQKPIVPIWEGDRDSYIEQVASFVIDAQYEIINIYATELFNQTATVI